MRKLIVITTLTLAAAPSAIRAAEPSAGCAGGTALAAGVTAKQAAPGDAMACNDGSTAPSPAKGALSVHTDSAGQSAYVDFDGDSNNSAQPCADGFFRVAVDADGFHFYEAPNGNYRDTDPTKKGNQQAQERDAQTFAGNMGANCDIG